MVTPLVIASSRRGEGKTTLALGLLSAFGRRGRKAGFIKPIGRATVDFAGQGGV
jgi:BioD-like phosphotransacetylase family protein